MGLARLIFGIKPRCVWDHVSDAERQSGTLKLETDGRFRLGPLCFDQNTSIDNTSIGGATVNKRAGVGEVLSVDGPGVMVRVKYDAGRWMCQRIV
jgi:hypothetical protein